MRLIKRLILGLLILAVVGVTLVFNLENQQPTSLVFLGFTAPAFPVSVIVCMAFIVGLILGPLLVQLFKRPPRSK